MSVLDLMLCEGQKTDQLLQEKKKLRKAYVVLEEIKLKLS